MSFATKADLQQAISDYMARTDLSAFMDDFVTLAEVRLNNDVYPRQYEATAVLTGTTSSANLTLPSDFSDPIGLTVLDTTSSVQYRELVAMTYDELEILTITGRPTAWAIDGLLIQLNRPCDQAYTFNLRYNQTFSLASSGSTNVLLTDAPNVYLAACMIEANIFVKDPQATAYWTQLYTQSMEDFQKRENASKRKAVLTADSALLYNNRRYWARGNWYF
jgi:hypothetical protein